MLATKVGRNMGQSGGQVGVGLSRACIRHAVHDSLRRLNTNHINLYQSHDANPNTPLAKGLSAFAELISEGKLRAVGASTSAPHAWPRRWPPAPNTYCRAANACSRFTSCTTARCMNTRWS